MTTEKFKKLVQVVLASSVSQAWESAALEWTVIDIDSDPSGHGVRVCGHSDLLHLFTIENEHNGSQLHPIGSSCVKKFRRKDLDRQVGLLSKPLTLRNAIESQQIITLTNEYFSRPLLEHLYAEGAFTPDQYNKGDGGQDYDFLVKMFNKRDKDALTPLQKWKINALLRNKVHPSSLPTFEIAARSSNRLIGNCALALGWRALVLADAGHPASCLSACASRRGHAGPGALGQLVSFKLGKKQK